MCYSLRTSTFQKHTQLIFSSPRNWKTTTQRTQLHSHVRLQKTTRNPGRVSCCTVLPLCSLLPWVSAEPSNLQHPRANPGTAQTLGEPKQRHPAAPRASHQHWNLAGGTSLEMHFFFFQGKNKVIINHLFQFFH